MTTTVEPTATEGIAGLFPQSRLAATAALLEAGIAVASAFEHLVNEPTGVDREQGDLIVRLATAPGGGLRGVDIAEQLMISPTRVSRLADRAEADGLIERQSDPDDRRAQRLVLTELGADVARRFAPRMQGVLDSMVFAEFSDQEITTMVRLLDRLRDRAAMLVEDAD
jgi:DNA-binding MarR family transcriptional regulator